MYNYRWCLGETPLHEQFFDKHVTYTRCSSHFFIIEVTFSSSGVKARNDMNRVRLDFIAGGGLLEVRAELALRDLIEEVR